MNIPQAPQSCATRYPLLLVHGIGFHDRPSRFYWGRIPNALEQRGVRVFLGHQDAWGSIDGNAAQIAESLQGIISSTGCGKVNIISHSKGGIDCRYLIDMPGCAEHISSLTTISSPHNGSGTLGWLNRWFRPVMWLISWPVNLCFWLLGDKRPSFYQACLGLTPGRMAEFNQEHPPHPDILYRHYAAAMRSAASDGFLTLTYAVIKLIEGENDGIVATAASRYGGPSFKGVLRGIGRRGASHIDVIDSRRRPLSNRGDAAAAGYCPVAPAAPAPAPAPATPAQAQAQAPAQTTSADDSIPVIDIVDFYLCIVRELKDLGL